MYTVSFGIDNKALMALADKAKTCVVSITDTNMKVKYVVINDYVFDTPSLIDANISYQIDDGQGGLICRHVTEDSWSDGVDAARAIIKHYAYSLNGHLGGYSEFNEALREMEDAVVLRFASHLEKASPGSWEEARDIVMSDAF